VVSFTPRPIYPQGKSPWYPLDRRVGGPQSCSAHGGEEKNSQPPPGIEPQNPDRPARSPALYRLSHHGSWDRGKAKHFMRLFDVKLYCVFKSEDQYLRDISLKKGESLFLRYFNYLVSPSRRNVLVIQAVSVSFKRNTGNVVIY
jgi:hypothetical protein